MQWRARHRAVVTTGSSHVQRHTGRRAKRPAAQQRRMRGTPAVRHFAARSERPSSCRGLKPRHSATAPSISDTAATWAVHCGYAAAAATRTALTVAIPQMMSGTDRARSRCARARNSKTPPATVANRRPGNRGPPVRNGPRAAPIAPNAAEAEKAAIKLVSQAWARIVLAFRRSGLKKGTSTVGSAIGWDSRASMTDSGADASTNANDMTVNAAPIACSGIAVIAATMAAVAPVTANATNAVNATAWLDITRMAAAHVAAAAAANNAFGAPGPPGTASRPASAAKLVASAPNVSPMDCSRETRYAIAAASRDNRAIVAATPAQPVRWASFA